jgi:hypothetical protein
MGRRRSWARHGIAVALGAMLLTAAGCGDLLGFQDTVLVHCVLASDCGESNSLVCRNGFCTPECKVNKDCEDTPERPVCIEGRCVTAEAPGPTVGDSGVEAADAPSDASDGASARNASEGGTCDPACSTFSVCRDQECVGVTDLGWSSPTGQMEVVEHGYLQAIQIYVDLCGLATGIGLDLAISAHETFRMALYSDNGGNPDALLAQTQPATFVQGVNEVAVTPQASIGCNEGGAYYWIVGTWSQDSVEFVTESTPVTKWIAVYEVDDAASIFANGFPAVFPAGGQELMFSQPHVYIIMAHS